MYRLIFMDFSMPALDGPNCSKAIRAHLRQEDQKQPYICFLSAYTQKQFKEIAADAGCDNYITNPIFKNQLHKVLIEAGLIEWFIEMLTKFLSKSSKTYFLL